MTSALDHKETLALLIDHISLGVPDIAAGCRFYDPLLLTLGVSRLATGDAFATYGRKRTEFLLLLPFDGSQPSAGNGAHIGFAAPTRASVDDFHRVALDVGGTDEGSPGERPAYPMKGVYAAFVRDPFGNKVEAVHNGFQCHDR